MEIKMLLSASAATGAGNAVAIPVDRLINGAIAIHVHGEAGAIMADVEIQGTLSTTHQVHAGTATWSMIEGGLFKRDAAAALIAPFPFIRAFISDYTRGTISVWAGISEGIMPTYE